MPIIGNEPCPSCQETGHDKTGNHLMVFDDGAKFCKRSHFHKNAEAYYAGPGEDGGIADREVTGKIKYTPAQFKELDEAGKLKGSLRQLALSGMKAADAWEVQTEAEREEVEKEWRLDVDHFETLQTKNLVSRSIKGNIAKFYNVRVGFDENKKVARHYYPVYEGGRVVGAKCRTLPKIFWQGTLGKTWGETDLFGQNTLQAVLDTGRRMDTLLLVGGECDAMAAQQMLMESQEGTQWAGKWFHIWSPMKGEHCLEEIIRNKDVIGKFKKIIVAFDADDVGEQLNRDVARLFRSKAMKLSYPSGAKDANSCLISGWSKQFVDAFFNPTEVFGGGKLKRVKDLADDAKKTPSMGVSWPWPSMDLATFGIQLHSLYVLGAGTGVGKTETTKEIAYHLHEVHGETVGVVYLEEQARKTVRSFAGKSINKRLEDPPVNDKDHDAYSEARDYTEDQANEAIDRLAAQDGLIVADTGGDKDIDTVMQIIEEFLAMGVRRIVIDNLTAIELPKGKGSKVEAIDEAMKRMGTFKDEKPVTIFLLSHLKRPGDQRTPHEKGGEVWVTDFRGAGSITFWANAVIGIERNTVADTEEEKRLTTYRFVKCRDNGIAAGSTVHAVMHPNTGRLLEPSAHSVTVLPKQNTEEESF